MQAFRERRRSARAHQEPQVHRSTRTRALTPAARMLAAPRVHAVVTSRARERQRVELAWH